MKKFIITAITLLAAAGVITGTIIFKSKYVRINGTIHKRSVDKLDLVKVQKKGFKISELNKCSELEYLSTEELNDDVLEDMGSFDKLECFANYGANIKNSASELNKYGKLDFILFQFSEVDLKGIKNNAVRIIIFSDSKVKNISELKNCDSLESISLVSTSVADIIDHNEADKRLTMKDSSAFAELDNVKSLSINDAYIEDISGINDMESLEEFTATQGMIDDDMVKELEDKGVKVTLSEPRFFSDKGSEK